MKKLIAVLLTVLMLFSLTACAKYAASEDRADAPQAPSEAGLDHFYSGEKTDNDPSKDGTSEAVEAASSRKLIRKIRISAETDNYQSFVKAITGRVSELGGYIEDIEARTSGSYPYATITVRVPADRLSELTDSVAGIGNITYKHESQQDVTLQYVDTESRIASLRTEQNRLLELLDRADNLSEILEIENRMTQVRYELESYERSLRALANQVDYATATITVEQVKAFTQTEEVGFWENIGNGLRDSLNGLWELLKDIFIFLVINFPYLLVFFVLPLIILIVLLKRCSRKKKDVGKADEDRRHKARKKGGDGQREDAATSLAEPTDASK